ncbi:MAG: CpsD/CapB family tyrosine-protein kinase, partial [Oscillospiraceae bacterium]|nr:CpsD/CapB family tyrosine-protein kinase [Oscillospiraceae bacterium]
KKICITSSASGEGKSITILNLAISLAEVGKKVLLIDADLRRPAIARLLREPSSIGLTNVLAEIVTPQEAIHKDVYPNLDIIFSGEIPPNPLELLNGAPMEKLIAEMSESYDYILVDTPPAAVVSDACVVANLLDGVLFLVRSGRSNKDDVKQALSSLQLIGARILGFVLNGVVIDPSKKYYKYYDKK